MTDLYSRWSYTRDDSDIAHDGRCDGCALQAPTRGWSEWKWVRLNMNHHGTWRWKRALRLCQPCAYDVGFLRGRNIWPAPTRRAA